MNTLKRFGALVGAGALVLAVAGTAFAADATPVGHYASSGGDGSNSGDFWVAYLNANFDAGLSEGDCDTKLEGDALAAVNNGDGSADLGVAYGWVIVKQASSAAVDFDNTIFQDVAADETVYADTNGNNVHDEGDSQGISHIIVCVPGEEETPPPSFEQSQAAATDTPPPSFEQSQAAETDVPTLPNTATVGGNSGSAPADGAWLLVVALGVLLSSIVVLTPARARTRR